MCGLIVVQESTAARKTAKPVICPKCKRGKLGNIHGESEGAVSLRGRPPPDKGEGIEIKCPVCGHLWSLTIEK